MSAPSSGSSLFGASTSGAPLRQRPMSLAATNSCSSGVSPCWRRKSRNAPTCSCILGLFLRRVGNDDPALFDFLLLEPLHQKAIVQRTNLHRPAPSFGFRNSTSPLHHGPRHP